ncbi:Acetylornithine deacetylase [Vibrio stylophorae]|uniref:Acetylornithine deacetylase n=1 Tax=Vibrio stylophorae TaxID=659351 RepID=A0ABN8DXT7_9VIBR|nr:acetylornithine deacetylase [Vibrio stylophorae]CAH0534643.1 Acetylornithine deacetylase [Vibrio stylophorae]
MKLPQFTQLYSQLIGTASISATESSWDQSNQQVIALLASWLSDQNFQCQIDEVAPGKFNLLAKRGEGDGGLMLSGHSDTVPFDAGRWDTDPFTLTDKDQRFYGLGTADMKGFFAFIVEALKSFEGQAFQKPLYILATCDEETSMAGARYFVEHQPVKPDFCVIGEPTDLVPIFAHKGHLSTAIRITGKSGHSSNPALGVNALEIMNEVLTVLLAAKQTLQQKFNHPGFTIPQPTLNLGHIHGGDSSNRICGCCELHYDIRPLPGLSLAALDEIIEQALAPVKARWPGRIEAFALHEPIPGYEFSGDPSYLQQLAEISGQTPTSVNYCTEAAFLQESCPTLVLGPGSIDQAHQPNEFIEQRYIAPTIHLISQLIQRFCC